MIKLIAIKPRGEARQIAYFVIDDKYDFSDGRILIALDTNAKVLTWLKKNEDFYMFLILQKMYRDGDVWADWQRFKTGKNTNLEAMQDWIAKGCKNKIQVGLTKTGNPKYGYQVIQKLPWRPTHPSNLKLETEVDKITTLEGLKEIVKKVIIA